MLICDDQALQVSLCGPAKSRISVVETKSPAALMVHADGGASSLLDIGQDELLCIYSLLGRQQQAVFPMLCRSIASILLASGECRLGLLSVLLLVALQLTLFILVSLI